MIRLLFVGDGPRDEASLPPLVGTILNTKIDNESGFRAWKSIRVGGYPKKLLFAIRIVRDRRLPGLVAVVDSDRQPARHRLRELIAARKKDRESTAPVPTALGEARPNVDAWLLDDATAVRDALQLSGNVPIPPVDKTPDPKAALNELISHSLDMELQLNRDTSASHTLPLLSEIAAQIAPNRCKRAKATGFHAFEQDVLTEFATLR
jgi:hypothetical protein